MEFESTYVLASETLPAVREMLVREGLAMDSYSSRQLKMYLDYGAFELAHMSQSLSFSCGEQCLYLVHKRLKEQQGLVCTKSESRQEVGSNQAAMRAALRDWRRLNEVSAPLAISMALEASRDYFLVARTDGSPIIVSLDDIRVTTPDGQEMRRFQTVELEFNGAELCKEHGELQKVIEAYLTDATPITSKYTFALLGSKIGTCKGAQQWAA